MIILIRYFPSFFWNCARCNLDLALRGFTSKFVRACMEHALYDFEFIHSWQKFLNSTKKIAMLVACQLVSVVPPFISMHVWHIYERKGVIFILLQIFSGKKEEESITFTGNFSPSISGTGKNCFRAFWPIRFFRLLQSIIGNTKEWKIISVKE